MGTGYMEGPAADEAERRREEADNPLVDLPADRQAVYGSTEADTDRHFLGWLGEVDPDKLFTSGEAWGLSVVRVREDQHV